MPLSSAGDSPVDLVLLPPVRDLGDGFTVRRALPSSKRRMVGPFIFYDQMGPALFGAGQGLDVRPHPHIGLATVTYLLRGEMLHRDSLGSVQSILPGAVNWMTAGSGIAHSERTGPAARATGGELFGLQAWVALPAEQEEQAPAFTHHGAEAIPEMSAEGVTLRLIAGALDGLRSPVSTLSDLFYADLALTDGARYRLDAGHIERAAYILSGEVEVEGQDGGFGGTQLILFKPGAEVVLRAREDSRLMMLGGEPFPEKRYIYWNFVSSSPDRIEQAKADWRERRFAPVPEETEFVPLPEEPANVHWRQD